MTCHRLSGPNHQSTGIPSIGQSVIVTLALAFAFGVASEVEAKTRTQQKFFANARCTGKSYANKDKACKKISASAVYACERTKSGAFKKWGAWKKPTKKACPGGKGYKVLAGVQPINQSLRTKKNGKKNLEGCAPVAGAMLMSYWWGKGYKKLITDRGYDGTTKPAKTIEAFFKKMKAIPFGNAGTATVMPFAHLGTQAWVRQAGYSKKFRVKRVQAIAGKKKVRDSVLRQIDKGNPVIMLFNAKKVRFEPRADGTGGSTDVNWHYVVVVGYDLRPKKEDDRKFLILDGWRDGSRSDTASYARGLPFGQLRGAGIVTMELK